MKKYVIVVLTMGSFCASCSSSESNATDSIGTQNGGDSGRGGGTGQGGESNGGYPGMGGSSAGYGGSQAGANGGQAGLANGGNSGTQDAGKGGSACGKVFWKPIKKAPIDENRIKYSSATDGKTVVFGGGKSIVLGGTSTPHSDSATYDPKSDTWVSNGFFETPSSLGLISKFWNDGKYAHTGNDFLWITNGSQWEKVAGGMNVGSINWGKMFFVQGQLIFWGNCRDGNENVQVQRISKNS